MFPDYQLLLESSPDAALVALRGTVIYSNPSALEALGAREPQQILDRPLADFLDPACPPGRQTVRRVDGTTFPAALTAWEVTHDSQRAMIVLVREAPSVETGKDEERLEREMRVTQFSVDHAGDGIFWLDDQGRILYANAVACSSLGYTREELLRLTVFDFDPDFPRERWESAFRETTQRQVNKFQTRHRRRDGTIFPVEITSYGVTTEGRAMVCSLVRDISERRKAEEELRNSEERFRTAIWNAPLPIMIWAGNLEVLQINRAWSEITGYASSEIPNLMCWARLAYRDDPEAAIQRIQTHARFSETAFTGEREIYTRDGSKRTWALHIGPLGYLPDGRRLLIAIAMDVTERNRLQEQLRQAQKLEAVGHLAGGVAHDFNNLLTIICGYTDLLLHRLPESSPAREQLQQVSRAGQRAAELTRQLLAFSRRQVLEPKVLDLNQVVGNVGRMVQPVMGEKVQFFSRLNPKLGLVKVDEGQIEQVLMNLVVNARDAMPAGGRLVIETANVEIGPAPDPDRPDLLPGRYVSIRVRDTGVGMDEETRSRIFEPFFTTKPKGKGTGLGLSTVYGIVKQSGGEVFCRSEPGIGTTFEICIPREGDARFSRAGEAHEGASGPGSGTVLLVEDDPGVRALASDALRSHGYLVMEAANGKEALALHDTFGCEMDLMVTDVVMPGMSGRELARRMTELCPKLPVLYISGYAENVIVHEGILDPGIHFLAKPFTADRLIRKVREVLQSP